MPSYATIDDLALVGLSPALYEGRTDITPTVLASMIAMRSSFAEDHLGQFYKLPLVSWGSSLTIAVSQLVAWDVLSIIGHDPDAAGTSVWRDRRDEAIATLERLAKHGSPSIVDSTPAAVEAAPSFSSEVRRGW
jgi:hypothetical protein